MYMKPSTEQSNFPFKNTSSHVTVHLKFHIAHLQRILLDGQT